MKRKEDPRFIRGKGTYVDDIQVPGLLYLDIVRLPSPTPRSSEIDTPPQGSGHAAMLAVITGQDLAATSTGCRPHVGHPDGAARKR